MFALFGRVFQPADTCEHGGRQAHKQIGDHFAVIPRADRDNAVQNAENHNHNLPDKIPFGDKDERSDAEQGRDQAQRIKILSQAGGQRDQRDRAQPQHPFKGGEICNYLFERFFHTDLQKKHSYRVPAKT